MPPASNANLRDNSVFFERKTSETNKIAVGTPKMIMFKIKVLPLTLVAVNAVVSAKDKKKYAIP